INHSNVPRVTCNGAESFMITWITNYMLQYNGHEVLSLENQKQQSMKVPLEYLTVEVEQ
ncbi:16944_t:CDS:1, partial [Gigaspora margarita]